MIESSKILENLFTHEEIALLNKDCDNRPVSTTDNSVNINKNLDYHLTDSVSCKIIRPKFDLLFGPDHAMSNGCYKIKSQPYKTHVDNNLFLQPHGSHTNTEKYNTAVLIPLVEDKNFCTITFKVFSEEQCGMGRLLPKKFETGSNQFDLTELDHIDEPARQQIQRFDIDQVFRWKIGSAFAWHKNQLHTSTNFAKFGLVKKFIILFIA